MAHLNKVAVWETADGVSITYFDDKDMVKYGYANEDEFIAWMVQRLKPNFGVDPTLINKSDIPGDRGDREHWSVKSGRIEVDLIKKKNKKDQDDAKESGKQAVLAKLGITKQELNKILK